MWVEHPTSPAIHTMPLTLAPLQLYSCWTSPLLSTVSITPFSSKFCNYNLVLMPQLGSGSPHSLPQCPTVLNSVIAHQKSVLYSLVSLKIQFLARSSSFSNIVNIVSQHGLMIHLFIYLFIYLFRHLLSGTFKLASSPLYAGKNIINAIAMEEQCGTTV